jgi:DNA anti-recombination protein RmuC
MDNKEDFETENIEHRISDMKAQFLKSYDVFIRANEQLSKISFDPTIFTNSAGDAGPLNQLESKDIDEILAAGSVDACISTLREKTKEELEPTPTTFPEVTQLLNIMNGLQTDIESLTESQKQFSKLVDDVNEEMSLFEARMEDTINQLGDLVVESVDGSDESCHDDFFDDTESFGSDISD